MKYTNKNDSRFNLKKLTV